MGQQLCLRSKESITALAVVTAEGKGTTHKLLAVIKIYSLQVSWLEMSFPDVYITGFGDETFRRYWGLGRVMGPHDGKVVSTRQRDLSRTQVLSPNGIYYLLFQGYRKTLIWVFPVSGSMSRGCFFRVAHPRCLVVK